MQGGAYTVTWHNTTIQISLVMKKWAFSENLSILCSYI